MPVATGSRQGKKREYQIVTNRTKYALLEHGQSIHRPQFIGSGSFRISLHQQRINKIQYEELRCFSPDGVTLQAPLSVAVNERNICDFTQWRSEIMR